jgi:hypothetical protein
VIVGGMVVNGRGGNDRICGLNGFDTLSGGKGNDRIDGGRQQDLIDGGPSTTTYGAGTYRAMSPKSPLAPLSSKLLLRLPRSSSKPPSPEATVQATS